VSVPVVGEAMPRTKLRIAGFDVPALHLALAVVGTMFIVVALLVDAALLAKAIVFGAGVVGTVLAFINRKQ